MPKIYDNLEHHLSKGLRETLTLSHSADFCVGYFNLRGWKEVADKIDDLDGFTIGQGVDAEKRYCRLLVGMQKLPADILRDYFNRDRENPIDNAEASKIKKRLALEFKEQLTIGTPSQEDENALQKLSQQLKDKKVIVKLFLKHQLHAKLYLAYSSDARVPIVGFLGSSNLTLAGLAGQGELNVDVMDQDAAVKLETWFEDRWSDRWCIDITEELIEIIDTSWASEKLVSPYHVYLKIAYHLSREARAGISEFKLPKIFQQELLDFQQKAVLVAAHHLHKRGGVMIGDVVGLGKTITASALARLFEDDFFLETLIICPKNLVTMWEGYVHKYQLRAKVLSQSKVQKELPKLRRYRLVIIDESHNLRNDQGSRYRSIKSYLDENDSKVILLTATPYNKSYLDLSNQLRLFIPDDMDLGISPERYIEALGGQVQFTSEHNDTFIRSIKAFEKSTFVDDWRELMRLYLVRRTRSFIKENYAITDQENGRKYLPFANGTKSYFPARVAKKVEYKFDPKDPKDQYAMLYSDSVVASIDSLELPRYGLANYLSKRPKTKPSVNEEKIIANLSRAGKRLMGFCRTNLFKRLESSGHSFLLSLNRHIQRNYIFIYALTNHLELPIGKDLSRNLDEYLEDSDTDKSPDSDNILNVMLDTNVYMSRAKIIYDIYVSDFKTQFDWIRPELFIQDLQNHLINDCNEIINILKKGSSWDPAKDRQLLALHELITNIHGTEKVLVFTQYADTAEYLGRELKRLMVDKFEVVTGDTDDPTAFAHRFSPVSNDVRKDISSEEEIRVLISTDVLSEGQNLQDAHIIVNFDLPWAIIRLIQRAGRVDRIGQTSDSIICYSFLPEDGIERIINLRARLRTRISQNAEVVGSDETFFDGDAVNITDLYNENSKLYDEDDTDTEVDMASYAYQIWKNSTDANPALSKIIPDLPNVIYATKEKNVQQKGESAIVYTRTVEDNDVLAWIDADGKMITQSQLTILKAAQCNASTEALVKIENHHELVKKAVDIIRNEEYDSAGTLGKKTSVKYRVYMRLDRYCKQYEDTLFVTEALKKAIDDIYKYPLKEYARETMSRQMKAGISDEQLAELTVSLREDDKLCIINLDEEQHREPQLICSLGLKTI